MITVNPTVEPITLAELKVQLGITDTNSDTVLTRRITEARKWAEGHTKRSIMPQTHERRIDAFADKITLPFPPVTAIEAIEYVNDAGTLTTIEAIEYVLDSTQELPFVRPAYSKSWPTPRDESSAVRVRYAAGYPVTDIGSAKTVTGITLAAPGVVTSVAHGFTDGDLIRLDVAGMTEIDGLIYRVYGETTDTFKLANLSNTAGISTWAFAAFTSGTATRVEVAVPEIIIEAMAVLVGHWTNFQGRIEDGRFITRVPLAVEQMLDSEKVWGIA